ncbi:MAG: DUF924 family protein [Pseudomonadota bacterium]
MNTKLKNPAQAIVDFWFGHQPDDRRVADEQAALWWQKNERTDRAIEHQFGAWLEQAGRGELDHWLSQPDKALALILLTDQFTRTIYRDTPNAFALDKQARRYCRHMLANEQDRVLRPIQRVFVYLPLEHSENLDDQNRCVELMRKLAESVPEHQRKTFDDYVDFAERHQHIIQRFGRFPHRNAILGRVSTAEEVEFLKQPGSSF